MPVLGKGERTFPVPFTFLILYIIPLMAVPSADMSMIMLFSGVDVLADSILHMRPICDVGKADMVGGEAKSNDDDGRRIGRIRRLRR